VVFVGVAHLSSGDAYGSPSTVPWAIELWGAHRHPTQVYEILLAVLAVLVVWRLRRPETFPGLLFLAWVALAATSQLVVEGFRADSVVVRDGIRMVQLLSLTLLGEIVAASTPDRSRRLLSVFS
jgi:prolipoprotein diacylglyceryltransferase